MEIQTKTKTEQILMVMHILAWIAFIGFMIEAGAMLVSYGVSCVNPEAARNLYRGLDLSNLREFSFWHYTLSVSLMVAVFGMKALASFLVIQTLSKVNLMNPFKIEVAVIIEKISYALLVTWTIAMASDAHSDWLLEKTGDLQGHGVDGGFIFMAGLVFIISQVFKRGVEIQSENDLTV